MTDVFSKIVINNFNRERRTLSKHACMSRKGIRKDPDRERVPDRENIRPIFFHDTDRIIHSLAYSRYIDKTQVFYLFENDHITHRVLHVQFVSKIARVIGRCLRLNKDLIEAIALGHDLGHAPFGHDGESILNDICKRKGIGFFCHNAQSVKFLEEIEKGGEGLNLSLQVLDGILSHNGEILWQEYRPRYDKDWDIFEEEYKNCFEVDGFSSKLVPMTLEGCVVRIADVIAYIGRDIEDAITIKLIDRKEIPRSVKDIIGDTNDQIINNLVMDLIKNSYGKNYLKFSNDKYKALDELKRFNYERIYKNPKIKEHDKIQRMFEQLFDKYLDDIEKENRGSAIYTEFLDKLNDDYKSKYCKERIVIDFISGMTDDFFVNQYESIFLPRRFGYTVEEREHLKSSSYIKTLDKSYR